MDVSVMHDNQKLHIIVLYKPPDTSAHKLFLTEFADLIANCSLSSGKLVVLGDFNYHVDKFDNSDSQAFLNVLTSMNMVQHVHQPTHKLGRTLDLILTRPCELTLDEIYCDDTSTSDHFTVICNMSISKPKRETKSIEFRKFKQIDIQEFKNDILHSKLSSSSEKTVVSATQAYNKVLSELLDKHAPKKSKMITVRPDKPWHNNDIRDAKKERRRREQQWRETGLEVHREMFKSQRNLVNEMCETAKTDYYQDQLTTADKSKTVFKVANNLLHRGSSTPLPSHSSAADLAERFANFFSDKIVQIINELVTSDIDIDDLDTSIPSAPQSLLTAFEPSTEEEISKLLSQSANKSCPLDPCPTWIIKECQQELLPVITEIVNLSLSTSIMPEDLKEALLNPLIKKMTLNAEIFKNFRPVSNLTYLSKLIERVVAVRLGNHLKDNGLYELLQSAYQAEHSTETALVKVQNDLLKAVDKDGAAVLVLLDLSAAFDTIDHAILINTLRDRFGITSSALQWIKSYLSGRFQTVIINGAHSRKVSLEFGVPQGSGLGPLLFVLYAQPVADIIRSFGLDFHIYADDTQIYVSFNPKSPEDISQSMERISKCVSALKKWMTIRWLKFNDAKTEVIVISTPHQIKQHPIPSMQVGASTITTSNSVRNLGVQFDSILNLEEHVSNTCKSAYFQIHCIGRIRKYLSTESAKTITHALVTSRLDYCNSLLFGLPNTLINKLQRVQNTAARLVSGKRKFDHISDTLADLHWLPIHKRIHFKILTLTYKAFNGHGPQYIRDMIEPYVPTRSLRSDSQKLLTVPKFRLSTFGGRSFEYGAALLWNRTPIDIRNSPTLQTFKSRLKTHYFQACFHF